MENLCDCIASWVPYVEAFSTAVIGVVVAYVAVQQYRLERNKHRHDLYAGRFEVYRSVKKVFSSTLSTGNFPVADCEYFWEARVHADFIFDEDIIGFLDEIWKKGVDLNSLNRELESTTAPAERERVVKASSEILAWFVKEIKNLSTRFKKHLKV